MKVRATNCSITSVGTGVVLGQRSQVGLGQFENQLPKLAHQQVVTAPARQGRMEVAVFRTMREDRHAESEALDRLVALGLGSLLGGGQFGRQKTQAKAKQLILA
jgi:hypothetical protein